MIPIEKELNEKPEGRFFAVVVGTLAAITIAFVTIGVIWCVACGVTKLIELIQR